MRVLFDDSVVEAMEVTALPDKIMVVTVNNDVYISPIDEDEYEYGLSCVRKLLIDGYVDLSYFNDWIEEE